VKVLRVGAIAVAVLVAALAGSVMLGGANAGVPATYYACADTETGVLRRVDPEVRCAEGEERLVWSDGQPEPTPPPPSHSCSFSDTLEWGGTYADGKLPINILVASGKGCTPDWVGLTRVHLEYTLKMSNVGGAGAGGQGWSTASDARECTAARGYNNCPPLPGAATPTWSSADCGGDSCTISREIEATWTRSSGERLHVLIERLNFDGELLPWTITGKIVLTQVP